MHVYSFTTYRSNACPFRLLSEHLRRVRMGLCECQLTRPATQLKAICKLCSYNMLSRPPPSSGAAIILVSVYGNMSRDPSGFMVPSVHGAAVDPLLRAEWIPDGNGGGITRWKVSFHPCPARRSGRRTLSSCVLTPLLR